jgi:hypothetical protein
LNIPVTDECYTLNGDEALAYVRSRHYKYLNPNTGKYTEDPASDYGRISRQQDFLRRAVAKILSQGFNLDVARSLIDVATKYVVVDQGLTLDKELQFAGVLKKIDPTQIQTYQIEGTGKVIGGAAVIEPKLTTDNMKAILAVFQGKSQLATAPTQVFGTTTTEPARTTTTTPSGEASTTTAESSATTNASATGNTTTAAQPTSTTSAETSTSNASASTASASTSTSALPESDAEANDRGIFPPADEVCP